MFQEHERKVRMSIELMDTLFTRDKDGNRLRVEWGGPDAEGFYSPIIHVDYNDNPLRDRLEAASIDSGIDWLHFQYRDILDAHYSPDAVAMRAGKE